MNQDQSSDKASNSILRSAYPQLIMGVICMVAIANYQYGWTFFVPELQKNFGWERAAIQIAFTLFVLFETWLIPVEGWLVDQYGPRVVVFASGLLCALGWWMNSWATSLSTFYVAQILSGIGAGGVYGTCIGNALKWFGSRRGFAAGLTAAGFGAGSALTVVPIQNMIASAGFQHAFLFFGLLQGAVICILAFLIVPPPSGIQAAEVQSHQMRHHYQPHQIIGPMNLWIPVIVTTGIVSLIMFLTGVGFWVPLFLCAAIFFIGGGLVCSKGEPVFLLMYLMFVLVGAGGLIVTANLAPIAEDLKVAKIPVSMLGLMMPALTFAATFDRILNGLTRPFFGWISDQIGREVTMFIAFTLEGIGIFALYKLGSDPVWFVILSGLVFFAWGEIYSLFPATCTDTFGTRYASANSGMLYTAKGTAALLVPYASSLVKTTGSWDIVFLISAAANIGAGLLAILLLRGWRQRVIQRVNSLESF
jgi:MFS transporter, OFA family, oxalate/formate antiporter